MKRPPIVVVMGHVDHGKTTLLDYIRRSNITAKEAGGITQSIGAYEIVVPANKEILRGVYPEETRRAQDDFIADDHKVTFIDTPGHEAFSKMRQRGAKIADLGILVVAADDSVQKQTIEAFKILEESKTPIIVAINKIDRPGVDLNKVKSDLAKAGILVEGYGGNISWQAISAKNGDGVNELLDLIILATDLENLDYDPNASGEGFILEAKKESSKGIVVSGIVKNGKLKIGDEIFSLSASGKIKSLENFLGKKVKEVIPSDPVLILGFNDLPEVGDIFSTTRIRNQESGIRNVEEIIKNKTDESVINLILKADTSGSLEALSGIIKSLPETNKITIIDESIGEITDGDIKSAGSHHAMIIGFRVKINKTAESLIKIQTVKIIKSEIVYELIKAIEDELNKIGKEVILGDMEILAIFGKKSEKQIVGGKVTVGEIKNNSVLEIVRLEQVLGTGKVVNLQQAKKDVHRVEAGKECGLLLVTDVVMKVGDHLLSKQIKN